MYNQSNQHNTIYSSYNVEITSTKIQFLNVKSTSNTYSLTNETEYDIDNEDDKYWLCVQFTVFNCGGCTIAPLKDHVNNKIYQELVRVDKHLASCDEKLYLDLRWSKSYTNELEKLSRDDSDLTLRVKLKDAVDKTMRLRVTGYSAGEYLYTLFDKGLLMIYNDCMVSKEKDIALAAWV